VNNLSLAGISAVSWLFEEAMFDTICYCRILLVVSGSFLPFNDVEIIHFNVSV
jgi:hypothetical protein